MIISPTTPSNGSKLQGVLNHVTTVRSQLNKVLTAIQTQSGLVLQLEDKDGTKHLIPKENIVSLPKEDVVPKTFFEECYATVRECG